MQKTQHLKTVHIATMANMKINLGNHPDINIISKYSKFSNLNQNPNYKIGKHDNEE